MFGMSITKLLIIGLACFLLYKLITNDRGRKEKKEDKTRERKIAAGEMVKDPICGSYVDIESSIKVRDGSKVHHFCSYDCREKFLRELQDGGREIPELNKQDDED